ncbi:MAG TPA: EndoU domain-containing protein [Thermoanaerobaculia bacterium]|nr:EndoU domain-containing protein [Thermoanaerobaculia bacterium]
MTRRTMFSALAVLAAAWLMGAAGAFAARWSDTAPRINETHVFHGEINKRGKPVGFHSRPGGRNPKGARVVDVTRKPNREGVYEARVEIRDSRSGRWLEKRSTLFPDAMDRDQVIRAILNAWRHRTTGQAQKFRGPSGRGFTIEGYLLDGDINTAYPIYR